MLAFNEFKQVVKSTPLVSIDLIVKRPDGRVLLGKRVNRPAQGYWFVPGGRIIKDETLEAAFVRLLKVELGADSSSVSVKSLGLYQHFYTDNFSCDVFTTHYIVLAYEVSLANKSDKFPSGQHCEYEWFSEGDILVNTEVHKYTKSYFRSGRQADRPIIILGSS